MAVEFYERPVWRKDGTISQGGGSKIQKEMETRKPENRKEKKMRKIKEDGVKDEREGQTSNNQEQ